MGFQFVYNNCQAWSLLWLAERSAGIVVAGAQGRGSACVRLQESSLGVKCGSDSAGVTALVDHQLESEA